MDSTGEGGYLYKFDVDQGVWHLHTTSHLASALCGHGGAIGQGRPLAPPWGRVCESCLTQAPGEVQQQRQEQEFAYANAAELHRQQAEGLGRHWPRLLRALRYTATAMSRMGDWRG